MKFTQKKTIPDSYDIKNAANHRSKVQSEKRFNVIDYKLCSFDKMMQRSQYTRRMLFVIIVLGFANSGLAQIGDDKLNVTMELALPSGRANGAYRSYLNGLVNVQPKVQYKFARDWYVAAGPKYSYYIISEFKVPVKMNGGAHTYGAFIEAGWHKWQTERLAIEIGCKGGLAQTAFVTDLTREAGIQRVTAAFIEPTFSLVLASDEAVAYRWIVGYNISGYDFKPYHVGLQTLGGFTEEDLNKPAQSLIVGFGMSYYFKNKRSDTFIDTPE